MSTEHLLLSAKCSGSDLMELGGVQYGSSQAPETDSDGDKNIGTREILIKHKKRIEL